MWVSCVQYREREREMARSSIGKNKSRKGYRLFFNVLGKISTAEIWILFRLITKLLMSGKID